MLLLQVLLPEKPDDDDETQLKKWKWKLRSVKKENRERHSQRCDVELKLAVSNNLLTCLLRVYLRTNRMLTSF